METEELLDAIRTDAGRISDVLGREGAPAAEVPSCPGWDVEKLVGHLGRVHRWVTAMVRTRSTERLDFSPRPERVDRPWFDEGVTELVAALEEAGPDSPMWTFPGGGGRSRFWFRRQAEETAVHRWDAQLAVGVPEPIETELALTGIDELLDVFFAPRQVDLGGSVHFHATDSPHGEWIVTNDPDGGLLIGHGHEKGDVALRATAGDLLLWLWGRPVPETGLEVFGDEAVLDRWRAGFSMG
ncbi:MAG TPA: maleylpyruvate isomerase family mycothiol-dependent enzyme [Acidimicrobiales bacterium]|nr:maleylpyruvate isomerase family mycothiol-dependent enzyme [Acidimicrobiales bacterium]